MRRIAFTLLIFVLLLTACGPSKNEIAYSQTITAIPALIQTQNAPVYAEGTRLAMKSTEVFATMDMKNARSPKY
jgi:hypothetical protein